ncbi:hypothetical protein F5882DRAFT_525890 [Hyaloscypha sp. PMI_1271]|nr:hypothetical protein F5882DRAFT_525890 [Hyaloscypha sp. PMI_1271]
MPAGVDEAMAVAGLALAVPGIIDLMIKYGAFIKDKIDKFNGAKGIWSDLRTYGVQLTGGNLNKMLLVAKAFYSNADADPKMKDDMELDIRRLYSTIEQTNRFLEKVQPKSRLGRLKFAVAEEAEAQRLNKTLQEQERALMMKINILDQYKRHVPPELLLEGKRFSRHHGSGYEIDSLLSVATGDYTEDVLGGPPNVEKTVLIEPANVGAEGTEDTLREIAGFLHRQLTDKDASQSDGFAKKGILPILGYRLTPRPELIFEMPAGFKLPANIGTRPQSLRAVIVADNGTPKHPLDFRFRLARKLCEAALRVHAVELVHKNIRPETVLLFKPAIPGTATGADGDAAREAAGFGDVYLTNWRLLRKASGQTKKLPGSNEWAERLYQHPSRQGLEIEERYNLGHDIYSLGVCLLEIGLWDSFVLSTAPEKNEPSTGPKTLSPSARFVAAAAQEGFTDQAQMLLPDNVKKVLLRVAREQLPIQMGLGYRSLVVACLTALDTPSGFGPDVDFRAGDRKDQVLDFVTLVQSYFQDLSKLRD